MYSGSKPLMGYRLYSIRPNNTNVVHTGSASASVNRRQFERILFNWDVFPMVEHIYGIVLTLSARVDSEYTFSGSVEITPR
ncbi:hypothetical protein [Kingella kingae]|uniref:hypothetical protein n=1 Tax=Kingella kingae TaxID=504 RepID=UPI0012BB5714|nr:hypothetical protein [Kingella kingae]